MTFKEKIFQLYKQKVDEKISVLKKSYDELSESAANETKSTAGDKHETALAMLQIEQENTGRQLKEAINQKSILEKIDPTLHTIEIVRGSIVNTNNGIFFMCIGLGKILVDENTVIALSPESPLGLQLMHLKQGDTFTFSGIDYIIERIE
jgi:transcription elongation GreA/GreB family factor